MHDTQIEAAIDQVVEQDGEMTAEEIYAETKQALNNMRSNVNEWAVRDTLMQFTKWGFYNGSAMAALGGEDGMSIARDIVTQALAYLEDIKHQPGLVGELYDVVYHYAR